MSQWLGAARKQALKCTESRKYTVQSLENKQAWREQNSGNPGKVRHTSLGPHWVTLTERVPIKRKGRGWSTRLTLMPRTHGLACVACANEAS